jgi:glycosyltransferase involved in cell wall biosynthesis
MVAVLQASAWYPPRHVGGTEVYVANLVRELRAHGISSRIVAPLGPEEADGYEFDGTAVRTYEVNAEPSRSELRVGALHQGFSRFREILAEERADIYHQHSWSRGLGLPHLRAAQQSGLKTVLTIHAANNICMRGTMMRYGKEACDGRIKNAGCASCWIQSRGAPKLVALALATVPPGIGCVMKDMASGGRFVTALCASNLALRRQTEFAEMIGHADRVVAVCQWLYDALVCNGVPAEKLFLNRQGVDPVFATKAGTVKNRSSVAPCKSEGVFRLLYLGRWHPVKGVDTLVRAVRAIPQALPLELVLHGVGDGPEEHAYKTGVRRIAEGDRRIQIAEPVSRDDLADTLSRASAIAVPSHCLETGPLVVLEAKAVGLPVIGSRLGGIAELVREPDDGLLVPPGNVKAWTAALLGMMNPSMALQFKPRASVRTMADVAGDMAGLYHELSAGTLQTQSWCE